ncbi:MAG: molybdenum cofactor biosynthesis protein B [Armatimonadota bacterium]
MRVAILIVSDRCSRGEAKDETGPRLRTALAGVGASVVDLVLVPDELERVQAELVRFCDQVGADVVFTSGGTGLGPRDVTPEATEAVLHRRAPGIAEAIRAQSLTHVRTAMLSRGSAGLRGRTLIVNLPGSPRGALQCLEIVLPVLDHAVRMIEGGGHGAEASCDGSAAPGVAGQPVAPA